MKTKLYSVVATALSALAVVSVMPASLAWVSNPKPPKHLLRK
ncbi:cyclic lactone autoinducer peptide [Paenibacillus xylanilyticus]|uniref:Cyclic lactone autoinducer peptide n=1 Tax=Paenibacillus xylanilyticus TaxID=248903 RepID=A0A7Y6BU04_9BACL|nr:cyclic lactone autoinducer peptide [Paenibacillus xylanilyticus]NUU74789.1 cyclic lactone autoinducer peptide [Paenibacillus xylanilyticus]